MSATPISVAVIQLNSQQNVADNLRVCKRLVFQAAEAGGRVILLPENFAFFGPEEERRSLAEPLRGSAGQSAAGVSHATLGPIQAALASWAKQLNVTLIGGGMPIASPDAGRPFNTSVVFSPEGQLVAHYHKIHLFDVMLPDGSQLKESAGTARGKEVVVCNTGSLCWGLSICYDLRFPELFRQLVDKGAQVLTVPAAFTLQTGKDHWEVLLRARAIESQCWVVAAGQEGSHPQQRRCFGNSMIIDPWGTVISRCSEGSGFALAPIGQEYLDAVRARVPSLAHRRL